MKSIFRPYLSLLLMFTCATFDCQAKKRSASVSHYYASQLPLKHPVAVIASDWDNVMCQRVPISIRPIYSTIALYNKVDRPVVVWTNNKLGHFQSKLKTVNKYVSVKPKGVFVHGKKGLSPDAYSRVGKPDCNYYLKAYAYTKKRLHLTGNDVVVFVDDLAENINAARQVARMYKLPIIAIQYTSPQQLEKDFGLVLP